MGIYLPPDGLSYQEEEKKIGELAKKIIDHDMASAALLFLDMSKPLAHMGGQFARMLLIPYLGMLGDNSEVTVNEYIAILEKTENVERLIMKVEELEKEIRATKNSEKNNPSVFQKLKSRLRKK